MGHSWPVGSITDANYIANFVGERLMAKGLLQSPIPLQRHRQGVDDPDSKLVFLSAGHHGLVVTVSPTLFPEVVAEEYLKAGRMRSHLGDLGSPILEPLDSGRVEGCSYAVLPYCRPLSKRRGMQWVHRRWVKHHLLEWLLQISQRRSAACEVSRYEPLLKALREKVSADGATAAMLREGEKRLRAGRFAARTAPMHGDLWKGNVLHGVGSAAFTLVDWRGSEVEGFPIFDLVRVAESFGLSPKDLHRELQLHRAALDCEMDDLPLYLLGALGHYAAHLGEMAPSLFQSMCNYCVTQMSHAMAVKPVRSAVFLARRGAPKTAETRLHT